MATDLSVGEVAKRSGVRVSTIHFYESKGLIQSWRTGGNQRRYPRSVLRRIAVIRVAQRAGIPLSLTKDHLDSIPTDKALTASDWKALTTAGATRSICVSKAWFSCGTRLTDALVAGVFRSLTGHYATLMTR